MIDYLRLAVRFCCIIVRPQLDVKLENLALQQQVMVLRRSSRRPRLTTTDRILVRLRLLERHDDGAIAS